MKLRRRHARGMTLVEVTITVAILALAVAVAVPAVSNISRGDLRQAASFLSSVVRETYDEAALKGENRRLVFTIGKGELRVESTQEAVRFDEKSGRFVTASSLADMFMPDLMNSPSQGSKRDGKKPNLDAKGNPKPAASIESMGSSPLINLIAGKRAGKAPMPFQAAKKLKLPKDVHVLDMWTQGMDQAVTEGEVYLYFFASGFTQNAMIHLADDAERVFTVTVQPLTGRASIESHYVEVPK